MPSFACSKWGKPLDDADDDNNNDNNNNVVRLRTVSSLLRNKFSTEYDLVFPLSVLLLP
jgi:hypothetical protein